MINQKVVDRLMFTLHISDQVIEVREKTVPPEDLCTFIAKQRGGSGAARFPSFPDYEWIARNGHELVAYGCLKTTPYDENTLALSVIVCDTQRLQGIGTAMIEAGEGIARRYSKKRIVLSVAAPPETRAQIDHILNRCGYDDDGKGNYELKL